MASTARAICGSSRRTADATDASSRFKARRISRVVFWSSPRERGFRCSVLTGFKERPKFLIIIAAGNARWRPREWIPARIVPRELSCGGLAGNEAEAFENGVVERGAHLANLFVGARGIHAVGEEHDEQFTLRINPEGCAREA